MNILNRVNKVPGGLLIIPMLIASVINTFCPSIFKIGDPTTAVFTGKGTMVVVGMILLVSGSQFKLSQVVVTLKRAGILAFSRIILGWIFGWLFIYFFGIDGFFGISAVALIATITSCNPGLYLALMNSYGDDVDCAAFGILTLIAVPIIPVMILNTSSGVGIDYLSILATLVPFLIGIFLGNVDHHIQKMFSSGTVMLLPFLGMCLGSYIDLKLAFQSGISGVVLTLIFLVVSMFPLIYIDKLVLKRPGYAAAAASSVAGISLVVPTLAASINSIYEPYINTAIAQIAFAAILTSIISPYITKVIIKRNEVVKKVEIKTGSGAKNSIHL
ncbi:2-keto-3-deoxygluconate permease [Priestia megaterium]